MARTEAQFNELQKRLDQLVNDNETDLLRDHLLHSQEELKQLKGEWVWSVLVGVAHNVVQRN